MLLMLKMLPMPVLPIPNAGMASGGAGGQRAPSVAGQGARPPVFTGQLGGHRRSPAVVAHHGPIPAAHNCS